MRVIEKLIDSLKDENPEVRDYAVNSLAKIGKAANPAAIQPLLEILNNKKEYGWIRGQAAHALACINPEESITPLIQKLTEEDIRFRQGLVNALGEIGKKAVPLLVVALSNENNDVRKGAVEALANIKDKRTLLPLLKKLNDADNEVRLAVVDAINELNDKEATEALFPLLTDSYWLIRKKAAVVLGQLGSKHALEKLIEIIQDEDADVRYAVIEALGNLADQEVIDRLTLISNSDNGETVEGWSVKEAATDAIINILQRCKDR